jgi:predicted nucleic acid-binding protein
MKVFLDANVLISVLNKEYPVYIYSSRVLSLGDDPKFQLYTSPICLAIAFYFSEKKSGTTAARKKIQILSSNLNITPIDKTTVADVFSNRAVSDFEDGLEYYAALHSKCKHIITEDLNDFHFSSLEIMNTRGFLEKYVL